MKTPNNEYHIPTWYLDNYLSSKKTLSVALMEGKEVRKEA
jgi:hypothetical protein